MTKQRAQAKALWRIDVTFGVLVALVCIGCALLIAWAEQRAAAPVPAWQAYPNCAHEYDAAGNVVAAYCRVETKEERTKR